ncbi:MAG: glycine--tRNA ligase subunit beta, partial [Chloroflexi bacterium]|nr:glycine--tRNA ligase subunit beta [Chloroflexota bacterium]
FARMRDLARDVASLYAEQRREAGHPLMTAFAPPKPALAALAQPIAEPAGQGPHDLLLEIGCEELPVADLDSAVTQLEAALSGALKEARLEYASLRVMGTPRRLVALASGVAGRQADRTSVVRGPAANIAFDAEGNPTRAAQGFARSRGVEVSQLQRRDIDGKEYVVAVLVEAGRPAAAVLSEALPGVVAALRFTQSMRWNASGVSFSRPIRWYVALLDEAVVPFEYAGVASGRVSRGIRPQGSPAVPIPDAASYERLMAEAGILLDVAAREASVLAQARPLAAEEGGELGHDAALLREVANLVEYPLAIRGSFDPNYLRLPGATLLAVMRKHQRYLPIVRDGELLPYFVAVANGATLDADAVRHGNEEVLRARYADAAYFYHADTQEPLAAFTRRLDTLAFQERLGSMLDKVRRLERLAPEFGRLLGLDEAALAVTRRAAALCKSDLATQLVVELTSLQGIMGRHYAALSGEPEAVAAAIEEHYLPRWVGDRLPETMPGVALGVADRLDTLVGLFAVDVRPSGAADPWGLRRAALGLIQLLLGKGISLSLPEALARAAVCLPVPVDEAVLADVQDYILRRYEGYLLEAGYRYDLVAAVLNAQGRDAYAAQRALEALTPWVARDDWRALLDTYARCVRITRDQPETYPVDPARFVEPATRALYEAYRVARARVDADPTVDGLFSALQEMVPAIRRFFDDVLVMDEDLTLRRNRLGLLQAIGALAHGIVDLSAMEGF